VKVGGTLHLAKWS